MSFKRNVCLEIFFYFKLKYVLKTICICRNFSIRISIEIFSNVFINIRKCKSQNCPMIYNIFSVKNVTFNFDCSTTRFFKFSIHFRNNSVQSHEKKIICLFFPFLINGLDSDSEFFFLFFETDDNVTVAAEKTDDDET